MTVTVGFPTQSPGHCQEGDLVDDGAATDRAVVTQPGPLPHHSVHSRLLDYTGNRTEGKRNAESKSQTKNLKPP